MTSYRVSKATVQAIGDRVVVPFSRAEPADSHRADLEARKHALSDLFERHNARLVRFLAVRLGSEGEAQEVAQEAYLRLLQPSELKHTDNLPALLYVTSRNIATDRLRRRGRQSACEQGYARLGNDVATPERIVSDRQQLELIRKLIGELPPKCQCAFISYRFYGMDYEEIAVRMELTESMVRKYVLRATAYCASRLDRGGDP